METFLAFGGLAWRVLSALLSLPFTWGLIAVGFFAYWYWQLFSMF